MGNKFLNKVKRDIKKYEILKDNYKIILGLSGGSDSVGLLLTLLELKKIYNIEIIAVHVNHMLRKNAINDSKFVTNLCKKYNVKLKIYTVDIKKLSKEKKIGVEEMARIVRKKCFESVLKENNYNKIALAHHIQDNIETILINLIRGSGISGLTGMKHVSKYYIRPFLFVNKDQIKEFVLDKNESWVEDESNKDNKYVRNYIRNKLIPCCKSNINKNIENNILKFSKIFNLYEEFVEKVTNTAYLNCVKIDKNTTLIDIKKLKNYDKIIALSLIKKVIYKIINNTKDILSIHIKDVYCLIYKANNKKIYLPYNLIAQKERNNIILRKINKKEKEGIIRKFKSK